ncbi:MAG: AAA family ATPase [Magnetococcales bacterium]|nr:AAA family ATPase [Magnetococcales bacterium]
MNSSIKLISVSDLFAIPQSTWIIKGILPETGIGAIFGPSGASKSFLAIDMAGHLSTGDNWFGYRTKKCSVTYCALEGVSGFAKRIRVYQSIKGVFGNVNFVVEGFELLKPENIKQLAKSITDQSSQVNGHVVFIDTLAIAAPGIDENVSEDMGRVVSAAKKLQAQIKGFVILIHHSGKDQKRGMRGHSSLHAACDVVIEVSKNGSETRSWRIAKSRDGDENTDHNYELETHTLGQDCYGDPITSCTVKYDKDYRAERKGVLGKNEKIILQYLKEMIGEGMGKIKSKEFVEQAKCRLVDVVQDRQAERTRAAIKSLEEKGLIKIEDEWISLIDSPTRSLPVVPSIEGTGKRGMDGNGVNPVIIKNGENGGGGETGMDDLSSLLDQDMDNPFDVNPGPTKGTMAHPLATEV